MINRALDRAIHDADTEIVGVAEGESCAQCDRRCKTAKGLVNCMMSWRMMYWHMFNDEGTGTYGDGGFSNFNVPLEDGRVHKVQLEGYYPPPKFPRDSVLVGMVQKSKR